MQFGSMLVYCTVYVMCVCRGPTSIFFQGAPNPLATALLHSNTVVSPNSVHCSPAGYTTTLILKTIAFTHFFKDCFNEK